MTEQVMQALGALRQMWVSGQIEGQPLPPEAAAARNAMPPEQFIGLIKQDEGLQKMFAQMLGVPPGMAGTYQAQRDLPLQGGGPPQAPPGMPQPQMAQQGPSPFQGGAWGDVNRGLQQQQQMQGQPPQPGPFN